MSDFEPVTDERLAELAQGGCCDETQRIVLELIEARRRLEIARTALGIGKNSLYALDCYDPKEDD